MYKVCVGRNTGFDSNYYGSTDLCRAVTLGNYTEVENILKSPKVYEEVRGVSALGDTPLNIAVRKHHCNSFIIFPLLVANPIVKETVNYANTLHITPLLTAIAFSSHAGSMIPELLNIGADANVRAVNGDTPLYVACIKRNYGVIRSLISDGHANPNELHETHSLLYAIGDYAMKHTEYDDWDIYDETVRLLVSLGADSSLGWDMTWHCQTGSFTNELHAISLFVNAALENVCPAQKKNLK